MTRMPFVSTGYVGTWQVLVYTRLTTHGCAHAQRPALWAERAPLSSTPAPQPRWGALLRRQVADTHRILEFRCWQNPGKLSPDISYIRGIKNPEKWKDLPETIILIPGWLTPFLLHKAAQPHFWTSVRVFMVFFCQRELEEMSISDAQTLPCYSCCLIVKGVERKLNEHELCLLFQRQPDGSQVNEIMYI